jgi:putative DNA primase/helicase
MSKQHQNDNNDPRAQHSPSTGTEPPRVDVDPTVGPTVPNENGSQGESGDPRVPDSAPDDDQRQGKDKIVGDLPEQEVRAEEFDGLADIPPPSDVRQRILLAPENFDRDIAKALRVLGENYDAYERAGAIVCIAKKRSKSSGGTTSETPWIQPLGWINVRELLSRHVVFQRPCPPPNGASKGLGDEDGAKATTAPRDMCEAIIARMSFSELPVLRAIIFAPTMRPDGTVLSKSGYDSATGLYADIVGDFSFERPPTRADALAALALLSKLFVGFPFVADIDRAIAIAACLAVVMGPVLDTKPAMGINATVAGTGKTYLIKTFVLMATGRLASPMNMGKSDEEMVKHLDAKLLKGDSVVAIDNIVRPIGGDRLCTLVSEPLSSVRQLGASRVFDVANAQLFATGNNLTVLDDMCRRILIANLDAKVERPELREFEFDALSEIYRHRQKYLRAVLTILLAHRHADPAAGQKHWPPLGSFKRWSQTVRDPLMWLGLPDIVGAIERNRENDPTLQNRIAVLMAIAGVVTVGTKFTTAELISLAIRQHTAAVEGSPPAGGQLREALLRAVGHGDELVPQPVGTYLGKIYDCITAGLVLRKSVLHGTSVWRIEKVGGAPVANT